MSEEMSEDITEVFTEGCSSGTVPLSLPLMDLHSASMEDNFMAELLKRNGKNPVGMDMFAQQVAANMGLGNAIPTRSVSDQAVADSITLGHVENPPEHIKPIIARRQANSRVFDVDCSPKMTVDDRNNKVFQKVRERLQAHQVRRAQVAAAFAEVPSVEKLHEEFITYLATRRIGVTQPRGRTGARSSRDIEVVRITSDAYIGNPAKHTFLHLAYMCRGHDRMLVDTAEISLSYLDGPV